MGYGYRNNKNNYDDDYNPIYDIDINEYYTEEEYERQMQLQEEEMEAEMERNRKISEITSKPTDPVELILHYLPALIIIALLALVTLMGWLPKVLYALMFILLVIIIYIGVNVYIFKRPFHEVKEDIITGIKKFFALFTFTGRKFKTATDEIYYKYLRDNPKGQYSEYNTYQGVGNNPYDRMQDDLYKEEAERHINQVHHEYDPTYINLDRHEYNKYYEEIKNMSLEDAHNYNKNKRIEHDKKDNKYIITEDDAIGNNQGLAQEFNPIVGNEVQTNGPETYIQVIGNGITFTKDPNVIKTFNADTEKLLDLNVKSTILSNNLRIVIEPDGIRIFVGGIKLSAPQMPVEYHIIANNKTVPIVATQLELIKVEGNATIRRI